MFACKCRNNKLPVYDKYGEVMFDRIDGAEVKPIRKTFSLLLTFEDEYQINTMKSKK